jgi:hypothetical protein
MHVLYNDSHISSVKIFSGGTEDNPLVKVTLSNTFTSTTKLYLIESIASSSIGANTTTFFILRSNVKKRSKAELVEMTCNNAKCTWTENVICDIDKYESETISESSNNGIIGWALGSKRIDNYCSVISMSVSFNQRLASLIDSLLIIL